MGFLSSFKSKIQRASDETVREVDDKAISPKDAIRDKKVNRLKNNLKRGNQSDFSTDSDIDESVVFFDEIPDNESVFAIDENDDGVQQAIDANNQKIQASIEAFSDPVPEINKNGEVQDVLALLGIPPTFEIEQEVLLPEDYKDEVPFDVQVPHGYDMGEVNAFYTRSKMSAKVLYELLKLRNTHIAKLASLVDRLQVDVNNARFDAEVANGINIMPTDSSEDLEAENFELRLALKKAQDEVKRLRGNGLGGADTSLVDELNEKISKMSDQVSMFSYENENLKSENYSLKNRLAVLEEQTSLLDEVSKKDELFNDDFSLPELSESEIIETKSVEPINISNSVFSEYDEDDDDVLSSFFPNG